MCEVEIDEIASGLKFPEGPIALDDGSVLVVEILGQTLTRIDGSGEQSVVARLRGGPNGAAIGPDGRCYICNNGGQEFSQAADGSLLPGLAAKEYSGGWIEAVDLKTGSVETLYTSYKGRRLSAPNDIVFDQYGGFWFTDSGKTFLNSRDRGGVFYALPDGSLLKRAIFPLDGANGIGLSPDGNTLYVAETHSARLWAFQILSPGTVKREESGIPWERGRLLCGATESAYFDSLAIDSEGNICVAQIPGKISVFTAAGQPNKQYLMPDLIPTNICFGGTDLKTAYITLSSTGKLVSIQWPRAGIALPWTSAAKSTFSQG